MVCENCFDSSSPQWRKINEKIYCNACGCYYQRHHIHRKCEEVYAKILINLKNGNVLKN